MTPAERESLRLSLLRFLGSNPTRFGLPLGFLMALCIPEGRPGLSDREAEADLLYLEDKGFIELVEKKVSPENRAWRITAAGRDYLAERGIQ